MRNFIIPSIDLLDGKIVRLYKGDYNKATVYNIAIEEILLRYKDFTCLHVVDLNGAKGDGFANINLLREIRRIFHGKVQVGGGIRSIGIADTMLNVINADRIVLGTLAIDNFDLTKEIINVFGKQMVVLAIDCELKQGKFVPKINGWRECVQYNFDLFDILALYDGLAENILVTDIGVDGTMKGSNVELYKQIKSRFPHFILQASGGVASMQDVERLHQIADYVVVGKALYEGLTNHL